MGSDSCTHRGDNCTWCDRVKFTHRGLECSLAIIIHALVNTYVELCLVYLYSCLCASGMSQCCVCL